MALDTSEVVKVVKSSLKNEEEEEMGNESTTWSRFIPFFVHICILMHERIEHQGEQGKKEKNELVCSLTCYIEHFTGSLHVCMHVCEEKIVYFLYISIALIDWLAVICLAFICIYAKSNKNGKNKAVEENVIWKKENGTGKKQSKHFVPQACLFFSLGLSPKGKKNGKQMERKKNKKRKN